MTIYTVQGDITIVSIYLYINLYSALSR